MSEATSTALSSILFLVPGMAVSAAIPYLIRKRVPHERIKQNNEVAGFIYAVMGVLYAVILGFAVLFLFEECNRAELTVDSEAGRIRDLYRIASMYPDPLKTELKTELKEYTRSVLEDEWSIMRRGGRSARTQASIDSLWKSYLSEVPHGKALEIAHEESLRRLQELGDLRRARLLESRKSIPGFLWFVLAAGALIVMSFAFLFGSPNVRAQAVMSALLSGMIGLILLLVFHLDEVFSGGVMIEPVAFEMTMEALNR